MLIGLRHGICDEGCTPGALLVADINLTSTGTRPWINNNSYIKHWDVITHPCPNFNDALFSPPLKLTYISNCIPYKTMDIITYPVLHVNWPCVTLSKSAYHAKYFFLTTNLIVWSNERVLLPRCWQKHELSVRNNTDCCIRWYHPICCIMLNKYAFDSVIRCLLELCELFGRMFQCWFIDTGTMILLSRCNEINVKDMAKIGRYLIYKTHNESRTTCIDIGTFSTWRNTMYRDLQNHVDRSHQRKVRGKSKHKIIHSTRQNAFVQR